MKIDADPSSNETPNCKFAIQTSFHVLVFVTMTGLFDQCSSNDSFYTSWTIKDIIWSMNHLKMNEIISYRFRFHLITTFSLHV